MPFPLNHRRSAVILWSLISLLMLLGAAPPDPPTRAEPAPPQRPPVVAAWLRNATGNTRPIVLTVATHFDAYSEVSAFSYTIEQDGTLTANNPVTDAVLVDFARLNGIKVVPTVSSTWESTALTRILKDPALRANHINAIMKIAQSPLVDGIDLDYENLPPDTRQGYTEFVTSLAALLHRQGKILAVTVPAKTSDDDSCVICKFADYAALGAAADQIRVMAYEFHGKTGGPGPNAPIWWVRQVMEYTASRVPRSKAVLGIHLYAYDWGGKDTPAYWWSDVQRRRERYGGVVTYVESDARGIVAESMYKYSIPGRRCEIHDYECTPPPPEQHTVWFVDAKYVAAAWDIVKDLQLAGIVMWRPGGEDPEIWNILGGNVSTN